MKKARRTRVIETAGSVFFDLFDHAEAQRLTIQSGLALALEQEIAARKWTQAEAARRLGMTQPRISTLRRRRLDTFSIDALIVYLARIGVLVRIDTSHAQAPPARGLVKRVAHEELRALLGTEAGPVVDVPRRRDELKHPPQRKRLTRPFADTVRDRASRDPAFRRALLHEVLDLLLTGDIATATMSLRGYIDATSALEDRIDIKAAKAATKGKGRRIRLAALKKTLGL